MMTPKDRRLDPRIDWLHVAQWKRRTRDRIAYRECLRLARVMRLAGRRVAKPRIP